GMLKRLHLPTVRRFYPECERRAEADDQSYRDFLATLIAEEVAHRAQTRIERSVHKARFPFLRTIEDFDFTFQTSVRLQLLGSYLGPELVTEGRSLILYGPSGTGNPSLDRHRLSRHPERLRGPVHQCRRHDRDALGR